MMRGFSGLYKENEAYVVPRTRAQGGEPARGQRPGVSAGKETASSGAGRDENKVWICMALCCESG